MTKKRIPVRIAQGVGLLVVLAGVVAVCPIAIAALHIFALAPSPVRKREQTVLSPDRQYEAVIVSTDGGATTSVGFDIYIERAGTRRPSNRVAQVYVAINHRGSYGVDASWTGPRELTLRYKEDRWHKLLPQTELKQQFSIILSR